jgi:hypothetical protein
MSYSPQPHKNTQNSLRPSPGRAEGTLVSPIKQPPGSYSGSNTAQNSAAKYNDGRGIGTSSTSTTHTTSSKPSNERTRVKHEYAPPPMVSKGPYYPKGLPKNTDSTLGGEHYCPPSHQAPGSYFNYHCQNTPASNPNCKIIPWDHEKKDYVYAAVKDEELRGRRRELKRVMDHHKQADYWDPVSCYNMTLILLGVLLLITFVVIIIFLIVSWESAKKYWYVLLVVPILILIIGIIVHLAFKNRANNLTFDRKRAIDQDLVDFSRNSGSKVRSGEGSSYLEVYQDNVTMPQQVTDPSHNVVTVIQAGSKSPVRQEMINLMIGDDLNDVSTSKLMNGEEVKVEKEPTGKEEGLSARNLSLSATSQKKQSFKERLQNRRNNGGQNTPTRNSPIDLRASAIESQRHSSHGMEYASFKPQQPMAAPKPMNLTLDDSALN